MREHILTIARSLGLDCVGFTSAQPYNDEMDTAYRTAVVALVPYYAGEAQDANLARYAWAEDYHCIVPQLLAELASEAGIADYSVCCDTGPHIDRKLAISAGLAFRGRNGMCIHPVYGSWCVVGYLVCNIDVPFDRPLALSCLDCGKCAAACPGGAISERGVDAQRCLSAITQKKGELSAAEVALVGAQGMAFGCDVCQNVCPHNATVPVTPVKAFCRELKPVVFPEELAGLSNRAFLRQYGSRAWSWRGKGVPERNLGYIAAQKSK